MAACEGISSRSSSTSATACRGSRSWPRARDDGSEVATSRGVVEVSEVTRGGTIVRTARFMAARVVALVEHPAEERASG